MVTFFEADEHGLVLNLELNKVSVVVLGVDINIFPGDYVCRKFVLMNVPVGDHLLGRVVDPLGRILDDKAEDFLSSVVKESMDLSV